MCETVKKMGNEDSKVDAHNGMEIERKYLIRMPDVQQMETMPGCGIWTILQTYLMDGENGETRRVRRIETNGSVQYIFTQKKRISALSHEEHEQTLTLAEYEQLRAAANPSLSPIRKRRYRIPYAGRTLEIDIYDFWDDRATLEVEIESESEKVSIPDWVEVIRDVTAEKAYKNRHLAKKIPYEPI